MQFRICPSCGGSSFLSTLDGDNIVFHVSNGSRIITAPDQTFDETVHAIDPWRIFCGVCGWGGAIHDLRPM